ncbi:Hypothetical_protein [Hexamita inflata]|uniref:Hypothetical_protein n=1 Tax=Hexamita inflata TaxID=28002 RepID=A0AA86R0M6_9EUKA|nr:Hypothetical protein HINF_LOCUS51757 [Hexamita inflata]
MYNCLYSLRYTSQKWLTYLPSTNLLCNVNSSCLEFYWFRCVQAKIGCQNNFKVQHRFKGQRCFFGLVEQLDICYLLEPHQVWNQTPKVKITLDCFMNTGLYEYMINYNYGLKQKSVSHLSSKCIAIAHHTKGRQFQQSSEKWKHTKYCFGELCLTIVNYCKSKLLDVSVHFHLLFKPFSYIYFIQEALMQGVHLKEGQQEDQQFSDPNINLTKYLHGQLIFKIFLAFWRSIPLQARRDPFTQETFLHVHFCCTLQIQLYNITYILIIEYKYYKIYVIEAIYNIQHKI